MGKQWKVSDFIFLGSKITADGDCSHEIKRRLLLGWKVMTNLDSIFKRQCLYVLSQFVLDLLLSYPTISLKPYIFFFFFLLGQGSLWDHRSMTRDGAWGLCSGSRSPYHWTIREFPRKLHYVSNKIVLYPLGVYAVISLEV